jgi:hypothetical protein
VIFFWTGGMVKGRFFLYIIFCVSFTLCEDCKGFEVVDSKKRTIKSLKDRLPCISPMNRCGRKSRARSIFLWMSTFAMQNWNRPSIKGCIRTTDVGCKAGVQTKNQGSSMSFSRMLGIVGLAVWLPVNAAPDNK